MTHRSAFLSGYIPGWRRRQKCVSGNREEGDIFRVISNTKKEKTYYM